MTCPGALDGVIYMAFFDALKEFFARSNCWLYENVVSIVPNTNDYVIDICQPVVVNRLMQVMLPRFPPPIPPQYLPMNPPQFLALLPNNELSGTSESINPAYSVPISAVLLNAGTSSPIMRIKTNPQIPQYWIATLALNISDPVNNEGLPNVPDWILAKYYDYLCSGVKSRLMLTPGKGYSSQQGAAFHGRKFNEGVGLARTETRAMFTYSGQRWTFPQGWNYRPPRIA
jgi:hypothetical protein